MQASFWLPVVVGLVVSLACVGAEPGGKGPGKGKGKGKGGGTPGVVKPTMADTIRACQDQGTGVSVCGEMAGDPQLTRLLLGMGLRSFSMHPTQILAVKQEVLRADATKLADWAERVIHAEDPAKLL